VLIAPQTTITDTASALPAVSVRIARVRRRREALYNRRLGLLLGGRECGQRSWSDYEQPKPEVGKSLPMTCILVSRIWYALNQIERPAYTRNRVPDKDEITIYTERQLAALFIRVQEKIAHLGLRVIVVDNARYLDERALDWMLDLRSYYHVDRGLQPQRALILCTRDDESVDKKRQLFNLISKLPEAKGAWSTRLELPPMNAAEFQTTIADLIDRNLRADIDSAIKSNQVRDEIWKVTKGNWWHLDTITTLLDQELGQALQEKQRIITQDVLTRTLDRIGALRS
jgi:hypothetical protein